MTKAAETLIGALNGLSWETDYDNGGISANTIVDDILGFGQCLLVNLGVSFRQEPIEEHPKAYRIGFYEKDLQKLQKLGLIIPSIPPINRNQSVNAPRA